MVMVSWSGRVYLGEAVLGPVEPALGHGSHPGQGKGEGPTEGPVGEGLHGGQVSQAGVEGPAVPRDLDGDVHDEGPSERRTGEEMEVVEVLVLLSGGSGWSCD